MDRMIVSLDLSLPMEVDGDPELYATLMLQVRDTLRNVYGIEVKHVAGTVGEAQYDLVTAIPDEQPVIEDVDLYAIINQVTGDEGLTARIYAAMLEHGYGQGEAIGFITYGFTPPGTDQQSDDPHA